MALSRWPSLLAPIALAALGCQSFDGPPVVSIDGLDQGQLADATAPITITFSEPVKDKTLKFEIVRYVADAEGNLGDEDNDPNTELSVLFSHHPTDGDIGGSGLLSDDRKSFTIVPLAAMPAGAKLMLLVEPGLSDDGGVVTVTRRRIAFSYKIDVVCDAPAKVFKSGAYFFLADVVKPVPLQVQLYGSVLVDETTGKFRIQLTNADRNADPNRCPMPCPAEDVCRLIPMPACVKPSEKAGTIEEFSDYVPIVAPPTGFTFYGEGCVVDQGSDTSTFATLPVDTVEVTTPAVTLRNTRLIASFTVGDDGILRGSGSFTADSVLLGPIASGNAEGGLSVRFVPEDEAPPDIPEPMGP